VRSATFLPRVRALLVAWLVGVSTLAAIPLGAQSERTFPAPLALDLATAIDRTLADNPGLRAIEERRGEVEAAIREARGSAFPDLALVSAWSRSRNPALLNSPDFEDILASFPEGSQFRPGTQELYRLVVELRQAIYTGGKLSAAVDLAEVAAAVTDAQIGTARLDAALASAEAYYRWLRARAALAALAAQIAARQEALAVVEARFELGDATRLEQLRAQTALAEIRPQVARAEGDAEVAEQELRARLGLPAETALTPAQPMPEAASEDASEDAVESAAEGAAQDATELLAAPLAAPSADAETLTAQALATRPELADLGLQGDALALQARIEKADGRPQVDFNGSYGREVRLIEDLPDSLFDDWRLSIDLRWQLFDGGQRRGRVEQLESQQRQIAWQRRDLVQRVRLEIDRALTGYRAAWASWQASTVAAETAAEARRVATESYQEGLVLQADLLDAQQQEVLAELQRVDAYYAAWTEAARLQRALGRLPDGRALSPDREPSPSPAVAGQAPQEDSP
jgi:outer membrane protein TolC